MQQWIIQSPEEEFPVLAPIRMRFVHRLNNPEPNKIPFPESGDLLHHLAILHQLRNFQQLWNCFLCLFAKGSRAQIAKMHSFWF